jgi:hypothetical protein
MEIFIGCSVYYFARDIKTKYHRVVIKLKNVFYYRLEAKTPRFWYQQGSFLLRPFGL